MRIEAMNDLNRPSAISLVAKVFPSQGLLERLSLRIVDKQWATPFLWAFGITSARFWLARSDGKTVGTTGLYTLNADMPDVCWLGWFCVDPEARGMGIGKRLLDHAVSVASSDGFRIIRLYTSTDPGEAAAQKLYEREGFAMVAVEQPLLWRLTGTKKLIRERRLHANHKVT